MPRLTFTHTKGWGGTGREDCKWMEEVKEDREGEPAERRQQLQSSNQPPADGQPHHTCWSQALRALRPWRGGWCRFVPAGVVWFVSQLEGPLHTSLLLPDVFWRLLLVCSIWMALGGCVHALRCCLRPGQNKDKPLQRTKQESVKDSRNIQPSRVSQSRSPDLHVPVALALANSLLLCLLQEPLLDPSIPYIHALLFRLESVSHSLEKAGTGSEFTPDEVVQDSMLTDKVKLISNYLQQRMRSLRALVQVQMDFEASVKDMLGGLDGLWAQLEELHTGVTLTKEGSQGHGDLALARADAENLFAALGHYRNRLQNCQTHLKDATRLLQELTWSHTHIRKSASSSSESVWPELLLQSNIEQFDKVQESFLSVEQQTSTFQAHLEGLRGGGEEGQARLDRVNSCSVSPQTSPRLHNGRTTSDASLEHCKSTAASTSATPVSPDTDTFLSLCERSALQFSSTFGRLRKSGRRK